MLKIEKNVPLPKYVKGKTELSQALHAMEVGDSVFIAGKKLSSLNGSFRDVLGSGNYTARSVDGGVRVWRTAYKAKGE